jgi:hypothetical protein
MPQFERQSRPLVDNSIANESLIPYCDNRDNSDSSDCDCDRKRHCDSSQITVPQMPRLLPVPISTLWRQVFVQKN